jgi:hypothetical protein
MLICKIGNVMKIPTLLRLVATTISISLVLRCCIGCSHFRVVLGGVLNSGHS